MGYKQVLVKIRGQREKALEKRRKTLRSLFPYSTKDWTTGENTARNKEPLNSKVDSKIFINCIHEHEKQLIHRRAILTLELPFTTDTVNVNQALLSSIPAEGKDRYKMLDEWLEHYYPDDGTVSSLDLAYQQRNARKWLDSDLPEIVRLKYSPDGTESFTVEKADIEDFIMEDVRDRFLRNIARRKQKESSKKVRFSIAKNVVSFCLNKNRQLIFKANQIPAITLASYFEYLEKRCLESNLEKNYKQLAEIRLLFYVPLTAEELQCLKRRHIDDKKLIVRWKDHEYPIPQTFVAFLKSLYTLDEPLFNHTSKSLYKFISQTSGAAKLKTITPTAIRNSQNSICRQEQFYPEKLPRR
jgi:hypothetical protein